MAGSSRQERKKTQKTIGASFSAMEQINRFGLQMFYTADLFDAEPYDGAEDYRLFYLGDTLKSIEQEKLYFPEFSHA